MGQGSSSGGSTGSGTMDEVKALTTSADVVMFISSSCPYCVDAQDVLKSKGISFTAIEASGGQRSALRSLTGQSSVPNCWVKGVFVGGCNDGPEGWMGIKKMANNGELQKRLK